MAPALVLGPLGTLEPLSPSLRAHTLLWFERTQLPRLRTPGHSLPRWLHGFATRRLQPRLTYFMKTQHICTYRSHTYADVKTVTYKQNTWCCIYSHSLREAEQLLQDKPQGCFLLRLSESKIGFALSYRYIYLYVYICTVHIRHFSYANEQIHWNSRGEDRCRHFIIEEEDSGTFGSLYLIAGEDSRHHSLDDLVNYYTHNPVGPFNEMLTVPCIQVNEQIERDTYFVLWTF